MNNRTLSLCGILLAVLCARPCVGQSITCPDTIAVRQQLSEPIPGWTAVLDDTPIRLASITFYDGRPEEKASLVSDETKETAGRETATWHFSQSSRQIWMACGYSGTAITLAQSLPVKITVCSVIYNVKQRVAGFPLIEKINCR